jgi:hypothetical protein
MYCRQLSWLPDCPAGGCVVTCARQGLAPAISIKLAAKNEKCQRLSIDSPLQPVRICNLDFHSLSGDCNPEVTAVVSVNF